MLFQIAPYVLSLFWQPKEDPVDQYLWAPNFGGWLCYDLHHPLYMVDILR